MEEELNDVVEALNKELNALVNKKGIETIKEKVYYIIVDILLDHQLEEEDLQEDLDFLTSTYALALTNSFDIDRDVESVNFGCNTITEQISYIGKEIDNFEVNSLAKTNSNILSTDSRNISVEDYFYNEHIEDDMNHIISLLSDEVVSNSTGSEDLDNAFKEFFENNNFINTLFNRTTIDVLAVYERIFGSGFELTPNYGVISLSSNGVLKINKANKIYGVKSVAFNKLSNLMNDLTDSKVNATTRQFDASEINSTRNSIYYPRKMVEYALGRITTSQCQHDEFKDFDGGKGWDAYAEGYVKDNLIYFLREIVKDSLISSMQPDKVLKVLTDSEALIEVSDSIEDAVKKAYNSFTAICIISELEGNSEDWASIEIKVTSSFFKNGNYPSSQDLISQIIKRVKGGQGNVSGTDYKIDKELVENLSLNNVVTYKHIFDPVLANKRPLFAGQALDSLVERGEKLNWENVLLGKGLNGKMIKSAKGQPIFFRDQLIHMMIAGSRSGKGVSSQNVLLTALASNIPVFYIDNKPDIATILKEVGRKTNDNNMFLVNGRSYEKIFDPNGEFDMNSSALRGTWERTLPQWWGVRDYSDIGDIVYFRGVLFTLGILSLRFWAKGNNPSLYEQLNGDGGVLIFYDEFTKWQRNFSAKMLNPRGGEMSFFDDKNFIGEGELREYEFILKEYERLMNKGDDLKDAERKKISEYEYTISQIKKEKRAYSTDIYKNLERSLSDLYDKQVAGFKGTEELFSDIFVVGQDIDIKPLPDNQRSFVRNKGVGKLSGNASFTNTCMISTFLYNFSTDYFMGYNAEKRGYMNADDPNSKTHDHLTALSRSFAYMKATRETVMNGATSTINANATIYKPYLILNNAIEPTIHKGMSQQEIQSASKEPNAQYVGGVVTNLGDEWWKLRESLIDETGTLREDIGFEGYLNRLVKENGQSISLSRSGDIADLIVRQMGYEGTYLEFLCDLRPEWNFASTDLVDAFANPQTFASGELRTPTFNKLFRPELVKDESEYEDFQQEENDIQTFYEDEEESEVTEVGQDSFNGFSQESSNIDTNTQNEFEDWVVEDEEENQIKPGYWSDNTAERHPLYNEEEELAKRENAVENAVENVDKSTTFDDIFETGTRSARHTSNFSSPLAVEAEELLLKEDIKPINYEAQTRSERYRANHEDLRNIEPTNIRSNNQTDFLIDYSNLVNMVTSDILSTVGGITNIESVIVRDHQLIINKLRYSKKFPSQLVKGLPQDRQNELEKSQYANLFNYGVLASSPNVVHIEVDDAYTFNTKLANDLGIRRGQEGVIDLFNNLPKLYYVTIEGREFTRDAIKEDIIKAQNFFESRERRSQVADSFYNYGRQNTRSSWNTTKELYSRNGIWNKVGGTAMLGVTGITGATTGGFNLTRKIGQGVKDFFSALKDK